MAGVEFAKLGSGSLGEMGVHFDNEIRGDARVHHSNETINQELTHLNSYIGVENYQELVERVQNIIEETDAKNPPKRVRKDRKVSFSLEIPCPPQLEGTDQEDIFYQKTFEMYKELLPGTVGMVIHKDEKHEYYDSKKDAMVVSRNHAHLLGACLTNDERINCKDLINQEMCQKANDMIQDLCLKEWGISYQTGEGRVGKRKSVEELKQESQVSLQDKLAKENLQVVCEAREEVEELEDKKKTLTNEIEDLKLIKEVDERQVKEKDKELEQIEVKISRNQAYLGTLQEKVEETITELDKVQNKLKTRQSLVEKFDDALKNLFTRFNKAYTQMQKIFDHWIKADLKKYKELVNKADKPIQKGNKAMETLMKSSNQIVFGSKGTISQEDIRQVDDATKDLKESTEELEEIEEEYGDYER